MGVSLGVNVHPTKKGGFFFSPGNHTSDFADWYPARFLESIFHRQKQWSLVCLERPRKNSPSSVCWWISCAKYSPVKVCQTLCPSKNDAWKIDLCDFGLLSVGLGVYSTSLKHRGVNSTPFLTSRSVCLVQALKFLNMLGHRRVSKRGGSIPNRPYNFLWFLKVSPPDVFPIPNEISRKSQRFTKIDQRLKNPPMEGCIFGHQTCGDSRKKSNQTSAPKNLTFHRWCFCMFLLAWIDVPCIPDAQCFWYIYHYLSTFTPKTTQFCR